MTTPQTFALALQHHQTGRLAVAEALYRQILAAQPNHAEALHHLGLVAHQAGQHDLAVELIQRAIVFHPHDSSAHAHLGEAWRMAGRLPEAIAEYRRAIELGANSPELYNNLGIALAGRNQFDQAIAEYRRALELQPGYAEASNNLGMVMAARGQLDEAAAAFRRALTLRPGYPEAHFNLGAALARQGRLDAAMAAYRRALELRPDFPEAWLNLGNLYTQLGQFAALVDAFHRALRLRPDYPEAYYNLGTALVRYGRFDEAIAMYRRALHLQPRSAEVHNNLGDALADTGQLNEAAAAFQRALELRPEFADAHNNLGNVLRNGGRLDEAVATFRRALEFEPNHPEALGNLGNALADRGELDAALAAYERARQLQPEHPLAFSNLAYAVHFLPGQDGRTIAEPQQRWNRQFAEPLRKLHQPHANDRDPERRLRIGYVSSNFHRHAICHFFLPLLEAHDQTRVEIYCYSSVKRGDEFTARVQATAGVWRDVLGLGDDALTEQIRADQIDILVDLTQHMAGNRLLTFARKPAPVQVAWLGYPASTGVPAMDYRFTDRLMEPEDSAWSASAETPVRLPDCWFCFDPIEAPEPTALPALRTGQITFGSLNNFCKVNETALQIWAKVLQALEGSRLLLHCPAGATQTRVREWFQAQGIAASRLELVPRTATRADYLQLYQRIDIGLDPFPYNGGTTTCEALWMGVPVVSLAGRTAVARLGLSILTNLGLPELVASSEDDYVRIATQLASDLPRLAELRATLRPRMQTSPLMDAPRFARNIEAAYRTMWQRWCAENPSSR